jgi:hypothetical protein
MYMCFKSTRYSCQILLKPEFSWQVYMKKISNFIQIRPVGAELFHADKQTDERRNTTKLTIAFLQFFERAKKILFMFNNANPKVGTAKWTRQLTINQYARK